MHWFTGVAANTPETSEKSYIPEVESPEEADLPHSAARPDTQTRQKSSAKTQTIDPAAQGPPRLF